MDHAISIELISRRAWGYSINWVSLKQNVKEHCLMLYSINLLVCHVYHIKTSSPRIILCIYLDTGINIERINNIPPSILVYYPTSLYFRMSPRKTQTLAQPSRPSDVALHSSLKLTIA